jgi:hypothetical protein
MPVGCRMTVPGSISSEAYLIKNVRVRATNVRESTLSMPHRDGTFLYIKLWDDPSVAEPAALPVVPEQ